MNLIKRSLPIIGLVVGLLGGAEAQESERLYPFVELTDADLDQIDVTDGSIDEWIDLLGEPTLTALDFQTRPDRAPYDPADMDYRVWLAWHGATHRIYVQNEQGCAHICAHGAKCSRYMCSVYDEDLCYCY